MRELSQQELADLADVERSTIWRIEAALEQPRRSTQLALGVVLRCDPDALFDGQGGASKRPGATPPP